MERTERNWLLSVLVALFCALALALAPVAWAATTALTLDSSVIVTIDEGEESVTYSFTPTASGLYTFYSSDYDNDPYGYLYDADGNLLDSNDDGGSGLNFSITAYLEAGETYYIEASTLSNGDSYTLTVVATEVTELNISEDGDSDTVDPVETYVGTYFSFSVSTSDYYAVTISADDLDGYASLYSADMTCLDSYEYSDDDEIRLIGSLEADETYYIKIYLYDSLEDGLTVSLDAVTDISEATVTFTEEGPYYYEGEAVEPAFVVTLDGVTLVAGVDYTYWYESYWVGTQYLYVYGIGDYAGELVEEFTVLLDTTDFGTLYVDVLETVDATEPTVEGEFYFQRYYTLAVDEDGWYSFTATYSEAEESSDGASDVYCYGACGVYDSDWDELSAFSIDSTETSSVRNYYLSAGTYYVEFHYWGDSWYEEDGVEYSEYVGATCTILVEATELDVTEMELDTTYSMSPAEAEDYGGDCFYYSYTAEAAGTYTLTLTASTTADDTWIDVWVDFYDKQWNYEGYLAEIYGDADSADEVSVTLTLEAGETYYFVLDYSCYGAGTSATITLSAEDVCTHDYVATETVDATCTADGYVVYTCSICGDTYTEVLEALGHDYVAVVTDPTCTEGGYTTYTCSRCDDSYVADETEATGHDYQISETTATCTEAGTTVYVCANDASHTYTVEAEALGHDYVLVETTATCTEAGTSTYTCSRCSDTYTEEVDALGHDYEATVTEPTCTEDGYTTYVCSVCGDTYVSDYVDALGHSYEAVVTDPTCEEDGYTTYTCSVCGDTYTDDVVAALGHAYDEGVYTDPTCTEDGYTTYTCQNDSSHSYTVTDEGTATGHVYGTAAWTYYYTVSSDGTVTFTHAVASFTCLNCGDVYQASTTELTVVENEDGTYTVTATVTGPDGTEVTVTDSAVEVATDTGSVGTTTTSKSSSDDELAETGDNTAFAVAGIVLVGAAAMAFGLAARKRRNVA